MSEAAVKVLEAVMGLSAEDRRWVVTELVGQLDEPSDDPDDPEFAALLERRIADHKANPHDALPADEALAVMRAELERRQACRAR